MEPQQGRTKVYLSSEGRDVKIRSTSARKPISSLYSYPPDVVSRLEMGFMVFIHIHPVSFALWILVSSSVFSNPQNLSTKPEFPSKMNLDASKRLSSNISHSSNKGRWWLSCARHCLKPFMSIELVSHCCYSELDCSEVKNASMGLTD